MNCLMLGLMLLCADTDEAPPFLPEIENKNRKQSLS
jgi:hypothetical protein